MRAYSLDLRQKVVAAGGRGDSTIQEVAATFGVGQTFVKKMLRQRRETADLDPRPQGGGYTPRLAAERLKLLGSEVAPPRQDGCGRTRAPRRERRRLR